MPEEQFFGGSLLPTITKTIIEAAGVTAILFIIIGGIEILTAYGNDEKIGKGKKTVTFAIVGLLISILSYAIVSIISGINLNTPTPTPAK
jgi:glucose uptake protein GlcU